MGSGETLGNGKTMVRAGDAREREDHGKGRRC